MRAAPPGDHEVPVPPPVEEQPPFDRFCDLVMTGGVASGVVYPWAVVEIARAYRFRNIGGTSVGAMAAALAAAAEYGRRVGFDQSFEALRRAPGSLAEVLPDGRTRMLSLFQPNPHGRRLVRLWGQIFAGQQEAEERDRRPPSRHATPPLRTTWLGNLRAVASAFRGPLVAGAAAGAALGLVGSAFVGALLYTRVRAPVVPAYDAMLQGLGSSTVLLMATQALVGSAVGFVWALWHDLRFGLIANNLGLVKGATLESPGPEGKRPGLCEWLHDGIQASAGRKSTDAPLTFNDLWTAPATPGAACVPCRPSDPVRRRSINLQMITTNVTHGRPYRLPLDDETSRLFYLPCELEDYFPKPVLLALKEVSRRYEPLSDSDPRRISRQDEFLELPQGDLPIVVAARLSLSFPLLFAAVPLWAIDYEAAPGKRDLRRCLFTDGGASSNFPIHLFDNAMPRWPTFGLWLDQRSPRRPRRQPDKDQDVWLPEFNGQGWGDNWNRFDPEAVDPEAEERPPALDSTGARLKYLFGFLAGVAVSATDWQDRTSIRLPHVRNRVARLRLCEGETGLHIGMSSRQILHMAHRFGTAAGRLFVDRFREVDGLASRAWSEQRWVRLTLLVSSLKERLSGLQDASEWSAHSVPVETAIRQARTGVPVRQKGPRASLSPEEVDSMLNIFAELKQLEAALRSAPPETPRLRPSPEMRLRAPL